MRRGSLWQISVTTSPEAEEAVTALLETLFARPPSAYFEEATGICRVSVYCESRREWTPAGRDALVAGLNALGAGGLRIGKGGVSFRKLRNEDWAESWKRHFKPLEIGGALLVKLSWSKRQPRKGQAVVVLDPGLSFGTGQHPTTAFCLRQVVACRKPGQRQSFLDVGTGSGIVAIAAAKLDYTPVHAFDFDPDALLAARANATRNRVLNKVRVRRQDLTTLPLHQPTKYDFICANLNSDLLLAGRERIVNRLRDGGTLVLAGMLRSEFAQVQRAYERLGLKLAIGSIEKEWHSGAFVAGLTSVEPRFAHGRC